METSHEKQSYEYSKSGLTVSVSSPAIDTIQSISNKVDRASEVGDKRLAALYDVQAVQALSGLDKKINNTVNGTTGKDGKKVSDISLNVSLGSTSKTQNSTNDTRQAKGSQISAGKNLDIIATGTNKNDGNVTIQGSTVTGDKVHIQAVKDVTIESAENQTSNHTQTDGKSSGIGAQISAKGVGFYAETSKNKELENGTILTHTPSVVTAKDTLKIEAGHDVNILGSKASGDRVEVNAGNNLNLASQQDIDNYNEKSSNSGGKIGTAGIGLQGNASKGKIDSNYESVTTQAEIHAGQGGFNIEVGKNTDLKGAVISSDATPDKNKISTDTLSYSDIKNKADYSASSTGIAYEKGTKDDQHKRQEGWRPEVSPVSKGEASSITQSGIAEGTLEIRADKNKTEKDKTNLDRLNRNPSSDYQGLTKIFDKNKIKEQQELSSLFAQEAYEQIGKIARDNHWAEGSTEKVLLHGAIGAIVSEFAGGNVLAGAAGSSVNEIVNGYIAKWEFENKKDIDPSLRRAISLAVGNVVGGLVGDSQTGGSTAWMGTQYNALSSQPVEVKIVVYDQDLLHGEFGHTSLVIDNKEVNYGRYVPEDQDTLRSAGGTIGEGAVVVADDANQKINNAKESGETVNVYTLNLSNSESANLVQAINDEVDSNGWHWTDKENNVGVDSAYRFNQGASYQKYVLWQRNCTTFVTDMLTRALPEGDTRLGTLKLVLAPHDAATILDQDVQGHGGDLVKEKL